MRAYRGLSSRAQRETLKELLRATNDARDAQVELAWLGRRRGMDAAMAAAARRAARPIPKGARLAFLEVRAALAPRLLKTEGSLKPLRRRAEKVFSRLSRRIQGLGGHPGPRKLHKLRLCAKKLRYLLEPLPGRPADLPHLGALKRLQRALGDIHDGDLIAEELKGALRALAERRTGLYARAKREWRRPQWGGGGHVR